MRELRKIPNIGERIEKMLHRLGVTTIEDLKVKDPYDLYRKMGKESGRLPDPCLLDTFIAAVNFAKDGLKKNWWEYTEERKQDFSRRFPNYPLL